MLIKELGAQGTAYEMEVMVASSDIKKTKGGKDYLSLTLQDSSGNISVNVWDGWSGLHKEMLVGNIFRVSGVIDKPYQDRPQIKISKADFVAESFAEYTGTKEFSPSYNVSDIHIQYMRDTINSLEEKYQQVANHMFTQRVWEDFIKCPAAKKHHGAKMGGLLVHTIAVAENVRSIYARYSLQGSIIPDVSSLMNLDRLLFMALIHDIGKIFEYVWIPAIDYRKENQISHIYHAVHMLIEANNKCNKIIDEAELQTICFSLISHHGEYGEVKPKNLEDWILHIADLTDAHLVGAVEG